jgi:hypothetical protein
MQVSSTQVFGCFFLIIMLLLRTMSLAPHLLGGLITAGLKNRVCFGKSTRGQLAEPAAHHKRRDRDDTGQIYQSRASTVDRGRR